MVLLCKRPVSDERATFPLLRGVDDGEMGRKINWFLVSKALMPASELEEATDFKQDHRAIRMPLALEKISEAKARRAGAWTHALVARDVETLWPFWCRAAEDALALPQFASR
eukprot:6154667-Amphidinium_carterae.3